ncbi:MAG: metal ABC transporter permease [Alphaproteobacteria bacterium GM202ARS2]|nr:metal ABC transporter permease [Alphaproteobacteria bacterium GM202ARS2]
MIPHQTIDALHTFLIIDAPPLVAASLCALSCALVGNFLLLQKRALLTDAVSHSVLPGIVLAFLIIGTIHPIGMTVGAWLAAWLTITTINLLKRLTPMDTHTLIGIVLTTMFATGVVLLERTHLDNVHLDIQHALFGNLSAIIAPDGRVPPTILFLGASLLCAALFIVIVYKELVLITFDDVYARTIRYDVPLLSVGWTAVLSLVLVAGFQAVGAILILSLVISPVAAAHLYARRLPQQIGLSLVFALAAVFVGYGASLISGINSAALIAISAGLIQIYAMFNAKQHSRARYAGKPPSRLP